MTEFERGQYAFRVVTFADGHPCIQAEPLTRAPQLSRFDEGRLLFELPSGTTVEEAQQVADFLSSRVIGLGYVPFEPGTSDVR